MGIKKEENLEVLIMKKMLKILAMLLVISTVVFVAGCSSKDTEQKPAAGDNNISQAATPEVTADNNTTDVNITTVPSDENATEVNTSDIAVSQNATDVNTTDVSIEENATDVNTTDDNTTDLNSSAVPAAQNTT